MNDVMLVAVPLLNAILTVGLLTLGVGLLPALWIFAKARRTGLVVRCAVVAAACFVLAFAVLPWLEEKWSPRRRADYTKKTKWIGFIITVPFALALLPEPLRLARRRVRNEPKPEPGRRRRRRRGPPSGA